MTWDLTRRTALAGALASAATMRLAAAEADPAPRLAELERKSGGRLGVAAYQYGTDRRVEYRADERFPMLSTFKFLAAAYLLSRVDHGDEQLGRRVLFGAKDLVPNSPVTWPRADIGMSLAEICEAAITQSDNTAGNLMLDSFGGPAALTAFARRLGDEETRLDRIEPALNQALAGDARDTTTPAAMLGHLRRILMENVLSDPSRRQITEWLIAAKTGAARLRAGFPKGWTIGDKTGTGENGSASDIAVVWPPGQQPIVVAVYLVAPGTPDARNATIANVARILTSAA